MFKVNNRNTKARCEITSKLTIKTPEWCHMFKLNNKETTTTTCLTLLKITSTSNSNWTPSWVRYFWVSLECKLVQSIFSRSGNLNFQELLMITFPEFFSYPCLGTHPCQKFKKNILKKIDSCNLELFIWFKSRNLWSHSLRLCQYFDQNNFRLYYIFQAG